MKAGFDMVSCIMMNYDVAVSCTAVQKIHEAQPNWNWSGAGTGEVADCITLPSGKILACKD